jgi:hypothetical protein
MAINYAGIRDNVAERLIRENGRTATLIAPGMATGPAWNPVPGEPVQTPVRIVELSMGGQVRFIESLKPNTLIQQGDKIVMVSTETRGVPEVGHTLQDSLDSKIYQIVAVSPQAPGPITMFWKVVIRK